MTTHPTDPPSTTLPPDDPRLALLRALNTPPYDTAAGKTGTALGEADRLIDAHWSAAVLEAANALAALGPADSLVSGPRAWIEAIETLRRMAAEKASPAELLNATEATT